MSFQKIFSLEKKFLFSRKVSSMNRITFVRSFVKNWKGKKKKITRDAKLFRILIFRFFDITHFPSGVSHARIN